MCGSRYKAGPHFIEVRDRPSWSACGWPDFGLPPVAGSPSTPSATGVIYFTVSLVSPGLFSTPPADQPVSGKHQFWAIVHGAKVRLKSHVKPCYLIQSEKSDNDPPQNWVGEGGARRLYQYRAFFFFFFFSGAHLPQLSGSRCKTDSHFIAVGDNPSWSVSAGRAGVPLAYSTSLNLLYPFYCSGHILHRVSGVSWPV